MTITIKKTSLSRVLTAAHTAVAEAATQYNIRPIEMRILMFLSDVTLPGADTVDSRQIEEGTGIVGSNVRKALYELDDAGLIWFLEKNRFQRLVVTPTQKGIDAADECCKRWEELVSA